MQAIAREGREWESKWHEKKWMGMTGNKSKCNVTKPMDDVNQNWIELATQSPRKNQPTYFSFGSVGYCIDFAYQIGWASSKLYRVNHAKPRHKPIIIIKIVEIQQGNHYSFHATLHGNHQGYIALIMRNPNEDQLNWSILWFGRVGNKASMPNWMEILRIRICLKTIWFFEVLKPEYIDHIQKTTPPKAGPLYLPPPLFITFEGQLTLFTTP